MRCVLLAECGSHAVVGVKMSRYDVSEVHGAHQLLEQMGPDMLVLVDAGITSGGFFEHVREQRGHALGALQAGIWEHLDKQRRLSDARCWHGCPQHAKAKRSIHYIGGRGCVSSPIASLMNDWEKRARSIAW